MSFKSQVKRALHSMGHYGWKLRHQTFPGVAVLCYHGVRGDDLPAGSLPFEDLHVRESELDSHCRLIRETCHPIDLARWREALAGGPPLPERPVLLTFDDAYRSFLKALAILDRYQLPAVLFACSGPIERRAPLWFDAVARARGECEVERLKEVPYPVWREQLAALESAGWDDSTCPVLDRSELGATSAHPRCEVGGHTALHPILAQASREDQSEEIAGDRRCLQGWLDRPVTAFAYPNGRPGLDYTAETVELVRQAGYDFAFTTRSGFATAEEPPLERSRFVMVAGITGEELAHRLCYSWPSLQPASVS